MASFTDTQGRRWLIEVNIITARRVKSLLGVDVLRLFNEQMQPLRDLLSDPIQFVDVLYVLCQEEVEKRRLTDEDFGRSLSGATLNQAADAFLEALTDFFPPERKKVIRDLFQKGRVVSQLLMEEAQKKLDQLDPEEVLKQFGVSSGNAPASLGSTLGPSPSANCSG